MGLPFRDWEAPRRAVPVLKDRRGREGIPRADRLRAGDLTHGDSGLTDRELNPAAYPAQPAAGGRTRGEVRAELAEAIRTGDIMASGDSGQTLREQYPARYGRLGSGPAGPDARISRAQPNAGVGPHGA